MKANDPVLHQQLSHIVCTGRRSVTAEYMVLFTGFYDDEKKARASMVTFDAEDPDMTTERLMNETIELAMRGLNAMLQGSDLEAILRNNKTGEEFTFGGQMGKVEIVP